MKVALGAVALLVVWLTALIASVVTTLAVRVDSLERQQKQTLALIETMTSTDNHHSAAIEHITAILKGRP